MGNVIHAKQVLTDGIHTPIAYEYANAAARTGATGFVSTDLYKLARQTDDNSIWLLVAITPTWRAFVFTDSPTIVTPTIASIIGNKIYPTADSTTAIQILNADGINPVVTVDTINNRVHVGEGIQTVPATYPGTLIVFSGATNNGPEQAGGIEMPNTSTGYGAKLFANNTQDTWGIATRYASATWLARLIIKLQTGNVGIRTDNPTAALHLPAGTTVAATAPLQFMPGPVESTPRAGLVEYTDRFIVTELDAANRYLVQAASSIKTTAGAPYTNDGYVSMTVNGTTHKFMTTA